MPITLPVTLPEGLTARPVKDSDAKGLAALVDVCFQEYEGAFLDLDDLDSDLLAYESHLRAKGGEGIVIIEEKTGELVGTIGCVENAPSVFELKRLYILPRMRGGGLAKNMLYHIENIAKNLGGTHMELWTDTRFERAHRFYEREGYVRQSATRDLHDISNTTEYQYIKPLV